MDTKDDGVDTTATTKGWEGGRRSSGSWLRRALIGGAALLVGGLMWMFIHRVGDTEALSPLEQTFFGLFTLCVGAGASWAISSYYANRDALTQYQRLARPALRRVVTAKESAEALLVSVERRGAQAESGKDVPELFEGLAELVNQHGRALEDAITDWEELLPEEVGRARLAARQAEKSRVQLDMAAMRDRLAEIEADRGAADPAVEGLKAELGKLNKRIDALAVRPASSPLVSLDTSFTNPWPDAPKLRIGPPDPTQPPSS